MLEQYVEAFMKPFMPVQYSLSGWNNLFDSDGIEQMINQGMDISRSFAELMALGVKAISGETIKTDQTSLKALGDQMAQHCQMAYDTALGKYLRMPRIGLGGKAAQEMMLALDAYYVLMGALSRFFQEFHLPLVASLTVFRENLAGKSDPEKGAKGVYHAFLKIADEKYSSFLNSPEGVKRVGDLIERYLDFKQKLDAAIKPLLKFAGIPTRPEMDDVCKRIHLLRKKNRELEAMVTKQGLVIEQMQKTLQTLEKDSAAKMMKKAPKTGKTTTQKKKRVNAPSGTARESN